MTDFRPGSYQDFMDTTTSIGNVFMSGGTFWITFFECTKVIVLTLLLHPKLFLVVFFTVNYILVRQTMNLPKTGT